LLPRELQLLIESTSSPDSPFHLSHASKSTDVTVYPSPSSEEPAAKRQKLSPEAAVARNGMNNTDYSGIPNLVLANKHVDTVHMVVKRECEQLADLCVSGEIVDLLSSKPMVSRTGRTKSNFGSILQCQSRHY
jgi:hypothetical protein